MRPAELVALERAAVLHGMRTHDPKSDPPRLAAAARVWTMNDAGELSSHWRSPCEVEWWAVRAWRAEDGGTGIMCPCCEELTTDDENVPCDDCLENGEPE